MPQYPVAMRCAENDDLPLQGVAMIGGFRMPEAADTEQAPAWLAQGHGSLSCTTKVRTPLTNVTAQQSMIFARRTSR